MIKFYSNIVVNVFDSYGHNFLDFMAKKAIFIKLYLTLTD
jgi:hypothetical protein